MRGEPDPWTAERVVLLGKLWAEGVTAEAIAARLGGLSRSAVLGKIFRLRLGAATATPSKTPQSRQAAADPARPLPQSPAGEGLLAHPALPVSPVRRRGSKRNDQWDSAWVVAKTRRKTTLDLTNDACRWPYGNPGTARFFFCGVPDADLALGIPYCRRHMRLAYAAPYRPGKRAKPRTTPASVDEAPAASSLHGNGRGSGGRSPAPRWG